MKEPTFPESESKVPLNELDVNPVSKEETPQEIESFKSRVYVEGPGGLIVEANDPKTRKSIKEGWDRQR